jgi:hypothetical protein
MNGGRCVARTIATRRHAVHLEETMRHFRALLTIGVAGAFVALGVTPALAAAPSNDTFLAASMAGPGFSEVVNTAEATTDSDDASANIDCGAPATDASVWYAYTQATADGVTVDVSSSNYSAGVIVVTGSPGAFHLVTCGPGAVTFLPAPGAVYYVLAFDYQGDGGGNGGLLTISFRAAGPPPTVDVTVNPVGQFDSKTGRATLSGTFTCANADFVQVMGQLSQSVGRVTINGSLGFGATTCDGTPHSWSATAVPSNGKFAGGKSVTVVISFACGSSRCANGFTEQGVQLTGGR